MLDAQAGEWFLACYGSGEVMRRVYDPGTGHAAEVAELEATRRRLRDDRNAGLYDSADDAEWYRAEYKRIGDEITALKALPERKRASARCPRAARSPRNGTRRITRAGGKCWQSSRSVLCCTRPGTTRAWRLPE